ncbi:MAG TPA: thiamine phosphate synthase, partial [Gemmatimonadaceae bacterium]|nr:thiamine phosphate synthase [Gemmatimonadaceae bacterium]
REEGGGDANTPPSSLLPPPIPVIHAVTDDLVLSQSGFINRARAVMHALGERGAVHLRGKSTPTASLFEIGAALGRAQERSGCWLVVNDRVDVALATGARAVQLTSRSMNVRDARSVTRDIAPEMRLGASVHALGEGLEAADAGADWLVIGNVFKTDSHPGEAERGNWLITELAAATGRPCIAIGGVRPQHIMLLRAARAYGVAAISGIWHADDAEAAAIEYLSRYDAGDGG